MYKNLYTGLLGVHYIVVLASLALATFVLTHNPEIREDYLDRCNELIAGPDPIYLESHYEMITCMIDAANIPAEKFTRFALEWVHNREMGKTVYRLKSYLDSTNGYSYWFDDQTLKLERSVRWTVAVDDFNSFDKERSRAIAESAGTRWRELKYPNSHSSDIN